mmetsp:Transcript_8771/g.14940  ORF Transcript_8771/g.14940 Transcript_8771/m.14940 type:complete len:83 (+) Transcript_8771:2355-2603(+)
MSVTKSKSCLRCCINATSQDSFQLFGLTLRALEMMSYVPMCYVAHYITCVHTLYLLHFFIPITYFMFALTMNAPVMSPMLPM